AWTEAGGAVETGHPPSEPFGYDAARASVPRVAPGDLGDARVIDVDTSDVYARGPVPGATWGCRSRLGARVRAVASDRARPIVTTCGDGRASTLAAATLRALGHDARVLEGGTRAWDAAGRPLESGATKLADAADDVARRPHDHGRPAMEAYL